MKRNSRKLKTVGIRELIKQARRNLARRIEHEEARPKTRADCKHIRRPCPFYGCKYNLYLDVTSHGSIVYNYPFLFSGKMKESCALDVADRGEITLEQIADLMNVSKQRVGKMWTEIRDKLRDNPDTIRLAIEMGWIDEPKEETETVWSRAAIAAATEDEE